MITEIVTFALPAGISREEVVESFEDTAPRWKANPDLIRKNFIVDVERGTAGGVYLWKQRADAEKWHGEDFRQRIKARYGSEPRSEFFETPLVVDNAADTIVTE